MKREFIESNVRDQLIKEGIDHSRASAAAQYAGQNYATSTTTPRGQAFSEAIKIARKEVRRMS